MKYKKLFKATIVALSTITIISTSFMNYTKNFKKSQIRYETYIVQPGDTLWKIAKRYTKDDPRKLIYEIREVNNITPMIYPGQTIEIPLKGDR